MDTFKIKCILAKGLDVTKISDLSLRCLNRKYKNNYVRIVNYHFSPEEERKEFEEQVNWFSKHFEYCNKEKLEAFLNGTYSFHEKPGIIFTFDDGFKENYEVANPVLLEKGATGWYMVSTGLLGAKHHVSENGFHDYMDVKDLRDIISRGGAIACHTYSHHRMSKEDTEEVLQYEIIKAKDDLEHKLNCKVDAFCWCGGEEDTYTEAAAKTIQKAGYLYSFMTNSHVILQNTEKLQLDRTNIETNWPISLVKFQICGFMDFKYQSKRKRVHLLTKNKKE